MAQVTESTPVVPLAGDTPHVAPGDVSGRSGYRSQVMFPSQEDQIAWLRAMVDRYKGNSLIAEKARHIVFDESGCPAKDKMCQATAIGRWVQKNVIYVNEGVETFQSPVRTLTYRRGDCDDFATLIASLLESIGIPSQLVGVEWAGSMRHIFPRAIINGKRVPLDATLNEDVGLYTNPIDISIARGDHPKVLALPRL
jgi:transglutaminase superfamily protein